MRTLTRTEMRWAYAAFGAIFPAGANEKIPIGICNLDLESYLTETRSRVSFRTALGLRLAIWMIALGPIFILHRLCTVSALDRAARESLMRAMLSHRVYVVRQLVMLLKAVGAVLYASAPAVRQCILNASARPELLQSGTRLVGIGKKEVQDEQHDEQSVA